MLEKVGVFSIVFVMTACGRANDKTLKEHLPGEYELYIGTNQSFSRRDFLESALTLKKDGTFDQSCVYRDSQQSVRTIGTWTMNDENIFFENLMDCAGVYPAEFNFKGGSLIVEGLESPQILLDPDVNIFYRRLRH